MKLSKKVLAAFSVAALLATSAVFTSCTEESDDDYDIVQRDNSDNFTINYTNDSNEVRRGYETTKAKHSGALTKVTLNTSDKGCGSVGYIWDLEDAKKDGTYSREAKDTRRFCIVGLSYGADGKVDPYVSMYKDVVDIQANNFGVSTTGTNAATKKEETDAEAKGSATEIEYLAIHSKKLSPNADANGYFDITIDVYEDGTFTWNEAKTKRVYTEYTGGYKVDIYNKAVTTAEIAEGAMADASATVKVEDLGYLAAAGENPDLTKNIVKQKTCAVYANVYAGKKLTAKTTYVSTYAAAEAVEE